MSQASVRFISPFVCDDSVLKSARWQLPSVSETGGYRKPVPMDEIESRVRSSVEKLGGTPELWLLHNPFVVGIPTENPRQHLRLRHCHLQIGKAEAVPEDIQGCWKIFEKLKDEGVLKSIGVSNFRPQDLEAIFKVCKYKPVCNQ